MARYAGIVAEFNPFHNGHAYLAEQIPAAGYGGVVAVMSGNFVQRGSPAVTDKRIRAKAALLSGVDLILELPLSYAMAPAQRFARGAISLLAATGCVDALFFGSECGDMDSLRQVSILLEDPGVLDAMKTNLKAGVTFAKARQQAVATIAGENLAALLAAPNNILGVEYLRAANHCGWAPAFHTVGRRGPGHDSQTGAGGFASASYLRQTSDPDTLKRYVPPSAAALYAQAIDDGQYPHNGAQFSAAMLSYLRRLSPHELANLPDLSEGLENKLYSALRQSTSMAQLEDLLKSKRYTLARIRRLILSAYLGITRQDAETPIPYIRVLGFNPRGRDMLTAMKATCSLPVSHSLAKLRSRGGSCQRFATLEALSTDLYTLALPAPLPCGYEYSASAVFFK